MEHVHGEDLRAIVRQMKSRTRSSFRSSTPLSIVLGVCAGLAYAHEKRDLERRAAQHRPSRHLAAERRRHVQRRREGRRLRHRQERRASGRGHGERSAQGQGPVHVARAGARRGGRLAERHLRRGRHALRADHGPAPLQGRERVRDAEAHLRSRVPAPVERAARLSARARGNRHASAREGARRSGGRARARCRARSRSSSARGASAPAAPRSSTFMRSLFADKLADHTSALLRGQAPRRQRPRRAPRGARSEAGGIDERAPVEPRSHGVAHGDRRARRRAEPDATGPRRARPLVAIVATAGGAVAIVEPKAPRRRRRTLVRRQRRPLRRRASTA